MLRERSRRRPRTRPRPAGAARAGSAARRGRTQATALAPNQSRASALVASRAPAPQLRPSPASLAEEARAVFAEALALAHSVETVDAVYLALERLRAHRAALASSFETERTRLRGRAALVAGALRALDGASFGGPAPRGEPGTSERLIPLPGEDLSAAVVHALERQATDEARLREHAVEIERELFAVARARLTRRVELAPPSVQLVVRVLPGERQVLHLRRPPPDDAAPLLFALTGRIPSRASFLGDDSTDDVLLPPPLLYPDEGLAPGAVRPTLAELAQGLLDRPVVWPLKACLLHTLGPPPPQQPGDATQSSPDEATSAGSAAPAWVLWRARGAVLEAELPGPSGTSSILDRAEAELVVATLLAHARARRLRLELADD